MSPSRGNNTAILILNHVRDRHLMSLSRQIARDYGSWSDVFLLSDRTQASLPAGRRPSDVREFAFETGDLVGLGYPRSRDIVSSRTGERNVKLGTADLPVLLFATTHSQYQYYWLVEYDVRFSGNWRTFFSAFEQNDADLLATAFVRPEDCPRWAHWNTLQLPDGVALPQHRVRGFFPMYRLSNRAVAILDREYRKGGEGHMEALMPTVLHGCGLKIEDIGGGEMLAGNGKPNRFYRNIPGSDLLSPGTFVYRPSIPRAGTEPDLLWHPVKPRKTALARLVSRAYARGVGLIKRPFKSHGHQG